MHSKELNMPNSPLSKGAALLDQACERIQSGEVEQSLTHLKLSLLDYRAELGPELWSDFARQHFSAHPFREMVHQSPFSYRSYTRPRGYAGDAVTLDYIYGDLQPSGLSPFAERVFNWERANPSAEAVRGRRDLLVRYIDETACSTESPAILAVACGHLRELRLTNAWKQKQNMNFTALDQDQESLAVLRASYGSDVNVVPGSVRSLIAGKHQFAGQDLVYAAGLYDYLQLPVARRLTAVMFDMLKPGGRLLVANFHPALIDIGAMETTMNWWLIYRSESEMAELTGEIENAQIAEQKIFQAQDDNLVYLDLKRA
jgi:SAM-dependent methyltransferase